jgi:hypothetical protein
LLKKLSALLAEKWEKPYSEICGYVNARMSIAMVRATGLPYPNEPDEQPPASMGGQGWPWDFPNVKIPLTNYEVPFSLYGEPGFSRVFAHFTARKHGGLITYF